ncbi:M56 family metallopeptidase [Flagellimonas pacifica]|nr:M56 family metallopeptidase [Allomuricauda parva]
MISLITPFITITKTVLTEPLTISKTQNIPMANSQLDVAPTSIWSLVFVIYLIGVTIMGFRLAMQFLSLKRLMGSSKLLKDHPFYHVQTQQKISPFSFFRYIFYHKVGFNPSELESVIEHEKVHASQHHSLDILFMELAVVLLWFNPAIWLYRIALKQNLEFLADATSCGIGEEKKSYQYLMLKQTAGTHSLSIANPFYNSLIKKRIVMLNQNQSKKTNVFKMGFILPAIALFLVSFNTKTEFVLKNDNQLTRSIKMDDKSIKLNIDKDTSDEELKKIKNDLAKDGVDFSYTVVHNDQKEIIDITLQLNGISSDGEKFSGNYNSSSDGPIKPLTIFYDSTSNTISFGNARSKTIRIQSDDDNVVWIDSDNKEHKEIIIKEKDGVKKITVNGKEVSEEELEEIDVDLDHQGHSNVKIHVTSDNDDDSDSKHKHVKIKKRNDSSSTNKKSTFILNDTDIDSEIKIRGTDYSSLFIRSNEKDEPIYYIDGKKATKKDMENLSPNKIHSINVLKGDKAVKTYGKKAKNGVIQITTKKK